MPWSALPEHLNSPEKWKGTDNDVWWMRWEILTKGWWAFGPRAKEIWARWRRIPIVLFAIRGQGSWRYEQDEAGEAFGYPSEGAFFFIHKEPKESNWYLSRVQTYCRWHFAIQWPLQISLHVYWNKDFMPSPPCKPVGLNIKRFFYAYGPIHRDADAVYWLFSFFVGGNWK